MARTPKSTDVPVLEVPVAQDELALAKARVAALESRIGEERLAWSICLLCLIDLTLLPNIGQTFVAAAVLLLQFLLILLLARLFGAREFVDGLTPLLKKLIQRTGSGS
jgi:hypothetical protein